eukprot:CAMPEP_0168745098 /NCGR_PEP_ID=MMETSP0724-20121128/14435_1 /TAXON_ID=265536 /ORGANISM="Amphiprora sp., Strain CCMP467" /LENGTH=434 /DNA_ID=CAMNT_0008792785 /DNA_START=238 /DNA_END=1542 /DNA_ORIENTATION=+
MSSFADDRVLHAHIECSQGVSTYCILEAALSIARDLGAQHRWIDELEDIMPRIFPGMLKNCYLRDSGSGKVAAAKVDFIPRKIQVYLDALNNADQNLLLSPWVREQSKAVLRELVDPARPAKADPVSFSVGHIVAALWCLDRLRVRSVTCSPVPWSSKPHVSISPTRLLRQALFVGLPTQFDAESYSKRTTGDGLALLRVLTGVARDPSKPISRQPPPLIMRASAMGSDDGSADDIIQIGLTVGELAATPKTDPEASGSANKLWETDNDMKQIEANIDDMTSEHLAYAMDLLLQEGANDAWVTPIVMKKGRSAHTLHCLCAPNHLDHLKKIIFQHTTTLGLRVFSVDRTALKRQVISVQLDSKAGDDAVDVKIGLLGDEVVSTKAEFDHCYRMATRTGEPIHKIAKAAVRKAEEVFNKHGKAPSTVEEASSPKN